MSVAGGQSRSLPRGLDRVHGNLPSRMFGPRPAAPCTGGAAPDCRGSNVLSSNVRATVCKPATLGCPGADSVSVADEGAAIRKRRAAVSGSRSDLHGLRAERRPAGDAFRRHLVLQIDLAAIGAEPRVALEGDGFAAGGAVAACDL